MTSKQSLESKLSLDFDGLDADAELLLNHKSITKKRGEWNLRAWIFLSINVFVFLINVGLLLMISVPDRAASEGDIQSVRLPHAGRKTFEAFIKLYMSCINTLQIGLRQEWCWSCEPSTTNLDFPAAVAIGAYHAQSWIMLGKIW
jgi:hypothetical protein